MKRSSLIFLYENMIVINFHISKDNRWWFFSLRTDHYCLRFYTKRLSLKTLYMKRWSLIVFLYEKHLWWLLYQKIIVYVFSKFFFSYTKRLSLITFLYRKILFDNFYYLLFYYFPYEEIIADNFSTRKHHR